MPFDEIIIRGERQKAIPFEYLQALVIGGNKQIALAVTSKCADILAMQPIILAEQVEAVLIHLNQAGIPRAYPHMAIPIFPESVHEAPRHPRGLIERCRSSSAPSDSSMVLRANPERTSRIFEKARDPLLISQ